jgi:hypothetical protein
MQPCVIGNIQSKISQSCQYLEESSCNIINENGVSMTCQSAAAAIANGRKWRNGEMSANEISAGGVAWRIGWPQ